MRTAISPQPRRSASTRDFRRIVIGGGWRRRDSLQSEGDPVAAIALLDEAERLYTPDFFPEVRPIAAARARAQFAAGRIGRRDRVGPPHAASTVDDELSYLREFDHVTLVRVLLAGADATSGLADADASARALAERCRARAGAGAACSSSSLLTSLALHKTGRRG